MDTSMQLSDFDFQLSEILLVHRNTHIPDFRWTQYQNGRSADGLVYCIRGCAMYEFGTETLELTAGQCLFLPAGCRYVLRSAGEESFQHYTVNFRLADARFPETAASGYHITDPGQASMFAERMEHLLSVWQGKGSGYTVLSKSILYELLYLYFSETGRTVRNGSDWQRLLPAIRALDERYTEDIPIAELSRMCSLSETHFRRLFVAVTGTSPTDYRIKKRLLRARDLLASGLYSVGEAARETGFSDPSYFSRVFRAHTGISPGAFRRGI